MSRQNNIRPVRVANCSGYHGDPAYEMYRQATMGDVDFLTGDYLAEVNLANNAKAWREGDHPGYEETAWEGIRQTIDVIAEKGIRVVTNGGALDPKALALKVQALVLEKGYKLTVAYVSGDDLYPDLGPHMPTAKEELRHLDSGNPSIKPSELTYAFLDVQEKKIPMVSAHAYLGARGIVDGLRRGADIVLCGRVADASPVIAAAWFWHDWSEMDYDRLAGFLIAGHLIECSAYVTGGNFAGFDRYHLDNLVAPGFPIAEIGDDGSCVITKHPNTQGMVNADTVQCQFLYELQGDIYLNSDVSAFIGDLCVEQVGQDPISGILASPPPPTTKLAVFYEAGFEAEVLLNATGYATSRKWDLVEKQVRHFVPPSVMDKVRTVEFQRYDPRSPINREVQEEPTRRIRLGDIALARSGDTGSNLNLGIFVPDNSHWEWPQSYMTIERLRSMLGADWRVEFFIERVEFPRIQAVHFVVYGIPGRGVSSSSRLDGFGKGFADYIRDKVVDFPVGLL
ncbi:DUF1446 domain-containing protein [Aspergillus violaceofuscus CBS 115571]|uniref:DUF1446 domain-containing protein n=1 Tax=Aspergillus violaceofuscus (strain CBS 115571) TaxID=1450538 RepID=A0A2V5HD90_ASPV1|nr:DUF1446 domain-containing protein [Aspergillus violaceofuscus CBS 115571]